MTSYTHFEFSQQRHRLDRVRLDPPLKLSKKWSLANVGYLPRLSDGTFFVSFTDGMIRAYNFNAQALWQYPLPGSYEPLSPYDGGLLISGKTVLTRYKRTLYLIHAKTGSCVEQHEIPGFDMEAAILQDSRMISLYGDERGAFCAAFDFEQGKLLWEHRIEHIPLYLAGDKEVVFLSDGKGRLICRDGATGEARWVVRFKDIPEIKTIGKKTIGRAEATGVPIIYEGLATIPIEKNHLAAFDLITGRLAWLQNIEVEIPTNVALYPDGNIYAGDHRHIMIINAKTGKVISKLVLQEAFRVRRIFMPTRFAVTETYHYVADIDDGVIVTINRSIGEIAWSYDLKTRITMYQGFNIIGGYLFVVDTKDNLYAFEQ